jgi:hypothetical protein
MILNFNRHLAAQRNWRWRASWLDQSTKGMPR